MSPNSTPSPATPAAGSPDRPDGRASWRWTGWLVGVAALFAVVGLTAWLGGGGRHGQTGAGLTVLPAEVHHPLPAVSLSVLDGTGRTDLRALAGHVTLVNLWASWCAPCRQESATLRRLWAVERGRGVRLVGVDTYDGRGAGRQFERRFALPYPSLFDPNGELVVRLDVIGLPDTFLVDRSGTIRYLIFGPVDFTATRQALDRLLAG